MGTEDDGKEMTIGEIKEFLKPTHNEIFDGYLCVGFRADNGNPILIGDVGHKWDNYRDCLRLSDKKIIKETFDEEHAESYWD